MVRFYGDETSGVEIRLIGFATGQCSGPQPLAARLSRVRRTACRYREQRCMLYVEMFANLRLQVVSSSYPMLSRHARLERRTIVGLF